MTSSPDKMLPILGFQANRSGMCKYQSQMRIVFNIHVCSAAIQCFQSTRWPDGVTSKSIAQEAETMCKELMKRYRVENEFYL